MKYSHIELTEYLLAWLLFPVRHLPTFCQEELTEEMKYSHIELSKTSLGEHSGVS